MSLIILASLFLLIFIVAANIKQQNRRKQQTEEQFWSRERRANSIRRKSLDGLHYIQIPLERFPTHILQQDSVVSECIETLTSLTSQKIVNLTGYTNTDLKLEYGTANITQLSEFDQNYTVLVRTLQKWADVLLETGHPDEAAILMEFAVETRTDIGRTYYALADYYRDRGEENKLAQLLATAQGLASSQKDTIVKHLREHCREAHT